MIRRERRLGLRLKKTSADRVDRLGGVIAGLGYITPFGAGAHMSRLQLAELREHINQASDLEALASDWNMVGSDIQAALNKLQESGAADGEKEE